MDVINKIRTVDTNKAGHSEVPVDSRVITESATISEGLTAGPTTGKNSAAGSTSQAGGVSQYDGRHLRGRSGTRSASMKLSTDGRHGKHQQLLGLYARQRNEPGHQPGPTSSPLSGQSSAPATDPPVGTDPPGHTHAQRKTASAGSSI